ncbi:MAG: PilZ domain-containing protein [Deltaproteobacteria bacterium]|nr:PilZ domain-containing protein [Deltaproteobacteria bacterium]
MTAPTPRPRDQRRSRRYAAQLHVDFQGRGGTHSAESADVARHGLFIRTPHPVAERHVVALAIALPVGTIRATALVTRTVAAGDQAGMGVQFFALGSEAKERWDRYVSAVEGQPAAPATAHSDIPVYLLKPRDVDRLRAFYLDELCAGRMSLTTPVVKDAGSELALSVVHPNTQQEFVVRGVVTGVHRDVPRRMDIQFHRPSAEGLHKFLGFVETGWPPAQPAGESPYAPPPGVVAPGPTEAPWFEIDLEQDDVVDDEHFSWEEVELEFALAEAEDQAPWAEVPLEVAEVEPAHHEEAARELRALVGEVRKPTRTLRVACDRCGRPDASLSTGAAPGVLGLLIEMKPHWCARCASVVAAPALVSPARRRHLRERVEAAHVGALEAQVPFASLLEVVDLSGPPRCGVCKGNLQVTEGIRALERCARGLAPGDAARCHGAPCPHGDSGTWVVTCVSGQVLPEDSVITMPPRTAPD